MINGFIDYLHILKKFQSYEYSKIAIKMAPNIKTIINIIFDKGYSRLKHKNPIILNIKEPICSIVTALLLLMPIFINR